MKPDDNDLHSTATEFVSGPRPWECKERNPGSRGPHFKFSHDVAFSHGLTSSIIHEVGYVLYISNVFLVGFQWIYTVIFV